MNINYITLKKHFMSKIKEISGTDAFVLTNDGAVFIDVRERFELLQNSFNIPNVLNIPLNSLESTYANIPKDKKVIFACRSGARSLQAAQFLVEKGWDVNTVFNLEGGIIGWESLKLPVKKNSQSFVMSSKPASSGCCGGTSCG